MANMNGLKIISALTIHLFLPLAGLLYFLKLKKNMLAENIENPPTIELFIIFATYGGLLLVSLTSLFWEWSGMASLGTFYLILGVPILMGLIAFKHRQTKHNSKYHRLVFKAGIWYYVIAPLTFLLFELLDQLILLLMIIKTGKP